MKRLVVIGLLVAVALAAGLSLYASSAPDGLEKVAQDHGFAAQAQDSATAASPLADYAWTGADGATGSVVAGIAGVAVTAAVAFGGFHLLRNRQS